MVLKKALLIIGVILLILGLASIAYPIVLSRAFSTTPTGYEAQKIPTYGAPQPPSFTDTFVSTDPINNATTFYGNITLSYSLSNGYNYSPYFEIFILSSDQYTAYLNYDNPREYTSGTTPQSFDWSDCTNAEYNVCRVANYSYFENSADENWTFSVKYTANATTQYYFVVYGGFQSFGDTSAKLVLYTNQPVYEHVSTSVSIEWAGAAFVCGAFGAAFIVEGVRPNRRPAPASKNQANTLPGKGWI